MYKSIFFLFIFVVSFTAISSISSDCPMCCFVGFCCGNVHKHRCCPTGSRCNKSTATCSQGLSYLMSSPQLAPSYVDIIMMVDGFFNAALVYDHLPESTKAFTKLVSMAPEIISFVNEIKQDASAETILEGFLKLYPKIQELIQESSEVPNELKKTFKKVLEILKTKEYYIEAFTHALKEMNAIIENINLVKSSYEEGKFAQMGRYAGKVVALVFNIQ